MSKLAAMKLVVFNLYEDIKDLKQRLHQLEEDEHNNKLTPAELHRMIMELKLLFEANLVASQQNRDEKIDELEKRISNLQKIIDEISEKLHELEAKQADAENEEESEEEDDSYEQSNKRQRPYIISAKK